MKKTLCLVLSLFMACGLFGCSNNAPEVEEEKDAVSFTEGEWTAEVDSMKGKMNVTVKTSAEKIEDITVEHEDTRVIADTAVERIKGAILEHQTLNVDNVTGATVTSAALKHGVEEALKEAGVDTSKLQEEIKVDMPAPENEDVDVVIAGAGGAGLTAAITAKNANPDLNVVVLEKLAYIGGSTRVSGGVIWMRNTEKNKEAGIDFEPEYLIDFMEERSGVEVNHPYVTAIGEQAGDFANYLLSHEAPLTEEDGVGYDGSLLYSLCPADANGGNGGAQVADYLYEHAKSLGIEVRTDSDVTSLIVEDGAVKGVTVATPAGEYNVNAKKTILATGGFTRNEKLIEKLAPEYTKNIAFTGAGSNGDGILMTEDLDTVIVGTDMMDLRGLNPNLGYYGPIGGLVNHPSLFVNKDGNRFMNEKMFYSEMGIEINRQEGKEIYGIVDSQSKKVENLDKAAEMGYVYKADTLEELADLAGVNKENMLNAVKVNNETKASGKDAEFGTPNDRMVTIEKAPYYIVPIKPLFIGSIPGLKVTGNAEVVNSKDEVIENLYACGELTFGNVFSTFYPASGSGVGVSVYSGAVAGTASAEALAE